MEILNKRTTYEVRAEEGGMTLSGNITVTDDAVTEAHFAVSKDGMETFFDRHARQGDGYTESLRGYMSISEEARTFALARLAEFETALLNKREEQA